MSTHNYETAVVTVPVHEYWLEHRRAMIGEMTVMREELLNQVAQRQRAALMGLDLLSEKLERSLQDLRQDARFIVSELRKREMIVFRDFSRREDALAKLREELDAQLMDVVNREKEAHYRVAQVEQGLSNRRKELEAWASGLHAQFLQRENELAVKARDIDRQVSVLFQARKKELEDPVGIKHIHNFARIYGVEKELPRVIVGQPVELHFRVSPAEVLAGMPAVVTYLDGKRGSVTGSIVAPVLPDGSIRFTNLLFNGAPGTSHIVLISIPRVSAGTVQALEVPVYLMSPPDIKASGHWIVSTLTLVGTILLDGVEAFGAMGVEAEIVLTAPRGMTFRTKVAATEGNEFHFEFQLGASGLRWEDIAAERCFIETLIPVTRFTNPVFHRFEVKLQSEGFPRFQFPHREVSRDCGLMVQPMSVPHFDLVTEVAIADGGRMLASTDVSGTVRVFVSDGAKWTLSHTLPHGSFVSLIRWGSGGSLLALQEPKQRILRVWQVSELCKFGESVPVGAAPQIVFNGFSAASAIDILGEAPAEVVAAVDRAVVLSQPSRSTELIPARLHDVTCLTHCALPKMGIVVLAGYSNGELGVYGAPSGKQHFGAPMQGDGPIVAIVPLVNGKILAVSSTCVAVIATKPSWAVMTSTFRTPSPIVAAAPQLKTTEAFVASSSGNTLVVLVHSDGNACFLDVEANRVHAYAVLKDARALSSVQCTFFGPDEFRVVACSTLNACAWGLKVAAPKEEADRREASFDRALAPTASGSFGKFSQKLA